MFVRRLYTSSYTCRQSQLSLSTRAMSNPLKRPAPATRDSSSSSIQIISPQKPQPKTDGSLDDKGKDSSKLTDASVPSPTIPSASTAQVKKVEDKAVEPPTKKPKIALVPGGAGSGGQTKLAFGNVGGGKTTTSLGKKAVVGGSGSSMGGSGAPPPHPLLSSSLTSSSLNTTPMKSHLALPIPSLDPDHTPSELSAHITHLRKIKNDFLELLTEEQKELLGMEVESMGDDWFVGLRGEFVKPYFLELKRFVIQEQAKNKVFPPAQDVYSWTRFCPLAGIRVVIIGQDPYHNDGQAHGLAFSVKKGVAVPPSLRNMYKELENEYPGEFKAPKHGDLSSWARQGVLLLNTSLTVRAHEANSHSKRGWEQFTERVIKLVVDRLSKSGGEAGAKGVCFLAWGAGAGKLVKGISPRAHHILTSAHPSPLSAARGFMGNGHFKKCNDWLEETYGEGKGIDWTSVGKEE